jgi:hypothetical protein
MPKQPDRHEEDDFLEVAHKAGLAGVVIKQRNSSEQIASGRPESRVNFVLNPSRNGLQAGNW